MKMHLSSTQAIDFLMTDEYADWSYQGATALVEHFETLEEDLGEEIIFNSIDFRCDYSEYRDARDWLTAYYGRGLKDAMECAGLYREGASDEVIDTLISEFIIDRGDLIPFDGGVIVSAF